jgi:hypothetical protein
MSTAFAGEILQSSAKATGVAANQVVADFLDTIVKEMNKNGKFTLASFGTSPTLKRVAVVSFDL